MKNGTTLLLLAALVLAGAACLTFWEGGSVTATAASLEATDSGAPSAMVIFPVGEKANPAGAGLKPVAFNHLVHEKRVEDCASCHHTGDTVSCTTCHTVSGSADGKFVTLAEAMHSPRIAKRPEGTNTPQSCVSCHAQRLRERDCAGCHAIVKPARDESWCVTCHNVDVTAEQRRQGSEGTLAPEENEALAAKAVEAKKTATPLSPAKGPLKVTIDAISQQYEPNVFAHRRHMSSLMEAIKDDKLAQAFHTRPETLCAACHHNSPMSSTPPACGNCHKPNIDPAHPERPHLKAAYHLQCMGCHAGMNVARPVNTSCVSCHKERAPQR
ncbi:MAG: cytochrome c family protein [Desulfovibrio sp.]|jgi:hypothetical protein|nr:cytochrome c family protein [Desulfovibrio sp.]